jgi:hypothetical protein
MPRARRLQLDPFTEEWKDFLSSGAETASGKKCIKWHLSKIEAPMSRYNLLLWMVEGLARTPNYNSARAFLALKISKTTRGFTNADRAFFLRRVKRIIDNIDE